MEALADRVGALEGAPPNNLLADAVAARHRDPMRVWSLQEIHGAKQPADYAGIIATASRSAESGGNSPKTLRSNVASRPSCRIARSSRTASVSW